VSESSENFYESWSDKSDNQILYDIDASVRKADIVSLAFREASDICFKKIIDFGCGYGKIIALLSKRFNLELGYGFDFSNAAINYAQLHFASDTLLYSRLLSLDISNEVEKIRTAVNGSVDCVLLVDVLEHVPDCQGLIKELAKITKYFFVKLPIEENILCNYILNKEYPSSRHSNGHLREFNVNNVYYFIRKLGLTPIVEGTYVYDPLDSFPPFDRKHNISAYIKRYILKYFTIASSKLLSKRTHLRLVGMGSYYCLATFDEKHVLSP